MRRVEIAFEANVYGYLLKNEETTIARLAECIHIVYDGGTHFFAAYARLYCRQS